jgi:hypothetical protein
MKLRTGYGSNAWLRAQFLSRSPQREGAVAGPRQHRVAAHRQDGAGPLKEKTMFPDLQDFIARHGGKPVKLKHRWLLPDGASITLDGPLLHQPPSDLEDRLKRILEHHQTRLKWAEQALAYFGSGVRWEPDRLGPMPTATDHEGKPDICVLKARLESLVAFRKAALQKVQDQLDKVPAVLAANLRNDPHFNATRRGQP